VTTQLQEVLRGLTHTFYEEQRATESRKTSKWKWEVRTNRFRVSYLSHTLHLLEAIILEARDEMKDHIPDANRTRKKD
jgi:hypothetical protein